LGVVGREISVSVPSFARIAGSTGLDGGGGLLLMIRMPRSFLYVARVLRELCIGVTGREISVSVPSFIRVAGSTGLDGGSSGLSENSGILTALFWLARILPPCAGLLKIIPVSSSTIIRKDTTGGDFFRRLLFRGLGPTSASVSGIVSSLAAGGEDEGVKGVAAAAVIGSISVLVEAKLIAGEDVGSCDWGGGGSSFSFLDFGSLFFTGALGFRGGFGFEASGCSSSVVGFGVGARAFGWAEAASASCCF